MKKTWHLVLALALLLVVVGCGSEGKTTPSNPSNPSNPVSNSWDSGKWDESSWQ